MQSYISVFDILYIDNYRNFCTYLLPLLYMYILLSLIIFYLNLMSMGYNFLNYVNFIVRRFECYFSIIGLIMMILSMTIKGEDKNELYL